MIDILLSTYNSENYLNELIDSILSQTYKNWRLVIRDDGSIDKTVGIINGYRQMYANIIILPDNEAKNIGTLKSFELLLSFSDSDYVMFCDHDDVWLPDKTQKTYDKMLEIEKQHPMKPVLIHTDLTIVDSEKNILYPSLWEHSGINVELLKNFNYLGVTNGITACTIMMNKISKAVSLPFSTHARMHDLWIGLCVSKVGHIDYVNEQTILYRQHSNNQIGIRKINTDYFKNKFQNIRNVLIENKLQRIMLKELEYGNCCKYLLFKFLYIIKNRL